MPWKNSGKFFQLITRPILTGFRASFTDFPAIQIAFMKWFPHTVVFKFYRSCWQIEITYFVHEGVMTKHLLAQLTMLLWLWQLVSACPWCPISWGWFLHFVFDREWVPSLHAWYLEAQLCTLVVTEGEYWPPCTMSRGWSLCFGLNRMWVPALYAPYLEADPCTLDLIECECLLFTPHT